MLDEQLFALYVLENFQRHSVIKPSGQSARRPPYAELSAFISQRRVQFDQLRRYYEKHKKFDTKVLDLYKAYERELDIWKEYNGKLGKYVEEYYRTVQLGRMIVLERAWSSALTAGLTEYEDGGSGLSVAFAAFIKADESYRRDARGLKDIEEKAWVALAKSAIGAWKDLEKKLDAARRKTDKPFVDTAIALRKEHGWKDAVFAFERVLKVRGGANKFTNPFLIVEAARKKLDDKDTTVDDLIEAAKSCQHAAGMVPMTPDGRAYRHFRAAFLAVGGALASKAASKDLGTAGLTDAKKNPPKGGALAYTLWTAYAANEPLDVNITDEVIHRYALACAYAGRTRTGYTTLYKNCTQAGVGRARALRPGASNNPAFWYDCARICSIEKDLPLSLLCLQMAVRLGYKDAEAAKADPDLKNVRTVNPTADAFSRLFP